ncbi:unnamed protein product, partial [Brassica oleracea var. botrytis]
AARPRACRHRRVSPLSLNSLFSFASSSCSLPSPSCPFLCSWSLVGVVFARSSLSSLEEQSRVEEGVWLFVRV